ncbi:HlyD family secretion protein [Thiomicrorhabdus sp. 6S3-12]|uniref:HlyD family secretion protein n=1 Tax=Thiomicrorhabdus sp. 6S3-12 TaxID=2819681 RepID=UPI001AADDFFF|nr:efflux RND transporter periplasmic adaptor subunit [Thiomicrorhabdus sp. 6S3-12]MBO1923997.1 efflux RND transporter periplasmic adaptor subunit [Thiomicrorhabdus sp. 6S3-12]
MITKYKAPLILLVLIVAASATGYFYYLQQDNSLPDGTVKLNGRTEADNYLASTKVAGKVLQLKVREGDEVKSGQLLALLDDAQVRARVTQAAAAYGAAEASLKAAQTALNVLKEQVPLQIETAESSVKHAEAVLNSAIAKARQAALDEKRYKQLYQRGTVQKHQHESALLAKRIADDDVRIARTALNQSQKALNETLLGWQQVEAKQQEVMAVKASTLQAQATLMEAMSVLDDMQIRSPADGIVTTRLVNQGEVIASGASLFNIVNLQEVYLKGYIAEGKVGLVHLGQKANIRIDSIPNRDFPATVRYIAAQTEFTPKEVQTLDERVKLVYAIKLYLDENPQQRITPGLPADAFIQVQ